LASPTSVGNDASGAARPLPLQEIVPKLKVQAILFQGAKSSLVINGRTFRLGDEVEGARIVNIAPQAITLEKGRELLQVGLHQP
jgi:hypothetical protein